MSKHTQGRLKMRQGFDDETKELYVPDSSIKKPFEPTAIATVEADSAEGKANARRLVACWNACEGIPTEALKDKAPRKLREDRDLLLEQRNELLAALRLMVALEEENLRSGDDIDVCFELESARAAIVRAAAKIGEAAKGGEA